MPDHPPQTLAQKLVARACRRSHVTPGEIVDVDIDFAFAHDSSGPRRWQPLLDQMGAKPWDLSKIAIVTDHYVPATDAESAQILKSTRDFVAAYGITNFFDMRGICHLVLPEHGLIRPGHMIAGGDSHTPMAGAFGAYAAGYGATDMAAIIATGKTWIRVPGAIEVDMKGRLQPYVTAKDIMLVLCRVLGLGNSFTAVEYVGEGLTALSMEERMVLANMAAELGCETGLVAFDEITRAYLATTGKPLIPSESEMCLKRDEDAEYFKRQALDLSALEPQIAAPHSPENSDDVSQFCEIRIDQAYIGACVGAKLDDLKAAATILHNRKVASGTRLLVAPASARVTQAATREGTLEILLEAGAILLPSGCGACAGMGAGILAEGENCISSTNRNFKGRMGAASASVYLGSPYSVAAAAVAGRIIDPREIANG